MADDRDRWLPPATGRHRSVATVALAAVRVVGWLVALIVCVALIVWLWGEHVS